MANIIVYLRKESQTQSHGIVWVKFYVDRKKVNFSTKVKCDEKNWSLKLLRVNAADKESKDKNLIIENILARINNVFVRFRLKDKKLTKDLFDKYYNRPDDYDTFYEFCEKHKRDISKFTEDGTLANHNKALVKLKNHAPSLHFDDITFDFLEGYFKGVLLREHKNKQSTAYKDMSIIRKYVHAARRAGYIEVNPFQDFKIKRTDASYTYLTEQELNKLITFYKKGKMDPDVYKTLQLFLFMCFGSQHVGDALKMRIEDMTGDKFMYYRQKLKNSKHVPVYVSVSGALRSIISDIVGRRSEGLIFTDMPAEQTMNRYLKAVCKLDSVKINKDISHKTGRHTFATFYLSKTKDINALKEEMGHSSIIETMKYAHVLNTDKSDNIRCFDVFMSDQNNS